MLVTDRQFGRTRRKHTRKSPVGCHLNCDVPHWCNYDARKNTTSFMTSKLNFVSDAADIMIFPDNLMIHVAPRAYIVRREHALL